MWVEDPIPRDFDLPEGWQTSILNLFEQGNTNEEVVAWILKNRACKRFSTHVFTDWRKSVPEFREIVNQGQIFKKAWWISQGRSSIGDNKFNTPLYIRMMGNLFAWKTELSAIESSDKNQSSQVDMSKWTTEEVELYRNLLKKARIKEGNTPVERTENVISGKFGSK
jgi:hypothetical protein